MIFEYRISEEPSKDLKKESCTVWIMRLNAPGTIRHNMLLTSALTKESIDWNIAQIRK